ncbi:hypothetical protein ACHAXT_010638 [Thalassiosira profunda]
MASGDPFACFGGDDSDSDSGVDDTVQNGIADGDDSQSADDAAALDRARHLVEAFNANKDSVAPNKETSSSGVRTDAAFRSSYEDQRKRTAALPWPDRPPLYLGPMALSDTLSEGGGRGWVATQELPPGTCILIEEPLVKGWSDEQMGKRLGLESVRYLLGMENASSIVKCMEELHPKRRKVEDVLKVSGEESSAKSDAPIDPLDTIQIIDMMADMNRDASHVQQVEALLKDAKERNVTNSDGSPLEDRDINRLLLAMRYNGFDSGLYMHFAMFNHSEDNTCIKFRPHGEKSTSGYYSEARTTRHVKKGEALTLHYIENPREVSHATRRKVLWDQHRFDIGDEDAYKHFLDSTSDKTGMLFNDNVRGNHIYESELVNGKFPPSSREGSVGVDDSEGSDLPATSNIENSLDDLEEMIVELKAIFMAQTEGTIDDSAFGRAAALELTVCELITASETALGNNRHILLSRCRQLHLDAVELLLAHCSSKLTDRQSVELMARFLPSCQQLLESQQRRLGNDHPDVARTCGDLSQGIQALLSHSPKRLLSLKLEGMKSLAECSMMESSMRQEKARIEALYPKDAVEILKSVQK